MKIFVISMFLSAVCTASAQTNTLELETSYNSSREAWRDTCFGLLDKSPTQIPSGYLLDYSLAGFDSWKYDGRGTDDETIDADGRFFSLYHILQLSKVNDQATLMPIQDLFISALRFLRDNQKIPLLFLFQPYQKINPSALGANLYSLDRDSFRLMDVPGRHRSPYNNNEIFIFCPAQTFISSYSAVRFSLPDLFWSMPGITSVQIDFGDGAGPRMCNKNSEIDVQYTTEGIKYLSARISTRDGTYCR